MVYAVERPLVAAAMALLLAGVCSACSGPDDEAPVLESTAPSDDGREVTEPAPVDPDQTSQPAAEATPSSGTAVAESLEAALSSDPARAASEESEFTEEELELGLPEGSDIDVDAASWMVNETENGGLIVITVTTPDGIRTPYLAVVHREGGDWKVLGTMPIQEQER